MSKHNCKYCDREMNVSSLAYKSNSYCNVCFDDRVKASGLKKEEDNLVFTYNGISVQID
ncbi:hypothetical protein [Aquimarina mytili]|uniref:Uncharacterized protein n=1 Tax=Aquimarina mytili TaxID=874423 RepID=A0A936ZT05_9FLAO|nr:hypothetical protein [Aquimarina mytili]MBL0684872.1 hypothetical protein [Aquimarina mytili]